MARKQSGTVNRILNFIGLVDAGESRDTYGDEYDSGSYGRRAPYTPGGASSRGRTSSGRQTTARRTTESQPRSRYDSRSASDRRYDDYRPGGTTSRFEDAGYDDRSSLQSSRYDRQSTQDRYARDDRYSRQTESRYDRQAEGRYERQTSSRYGASAARAGAAQPPVPQRPAMKVSRRSKTVMYSLHSLEDCCEVIDQLIANNTVVLTMEELDGSLMQRAVDTLSGAVFALHASIRKASDKTYLVAPMSVEVNAADEESRRY